MDMEGSGRRQSADISIHVDGRLLGCCAMYTGITTPKTAIFMLTALRTSNLTFCFMLYA
jgi:hypothetical protein